MADKRFIVFIIIFFSLTLLTGEDTSGIFIPPGGSDKFNAESTINKIMNKKKEKLTAIDKSIDDIKSKIKIWNEIKSKALSLQDKAQKLYDMDSPFDRKICKSSNENAFTATAMKNVNVGEYKIKINSTASSHIIASKPLEKNFKIPPGEYNFQIGDDKAKVSFSGGNVESFAEKIREDYGNILKTSITWDTPRTEVFVLEAAKTGGKNFINFTDDRTKKIFKEMDFFEDVQSYDKNFSIDRSGISNISDIKRDIQFNGSMLVVGRMQDYKFSLPETIPYKDRLIMEAELKLDTLDQNSTPEELNPTGPNFEKSGDLNLFDIQVEGEGTKVNILPYKKPEKPKVVTDNHFLSLVTDKRTIDLDELNLAPDFKTYKFDVNKLLNKAETIQAVIFKNGNTYKRLEVGKIRFYDEGSEMKMRFKHELSEPHDADFTFNGIEVKRDTNTITDLIKGLTLYILDKTNKEETLKIDRDYENIVKAITDFLSDFNELIKQANKETDSNYNDEGKTGSFAGDFGLTNLISKLRIIMMNPYPTSYGDELSLLAQIGISTNSEGFGVMDKTKLKGVLEVNENKFLEEVEKYPKGVKELFGMDTDGDYLVDNGAAFQIEKLLKMYTERDGGFFDLKSKEFKDQIASIEKDKKAYQDKLTEDEKKLKKEFYQMEKASNDLEESKKKFDNMNKQPQ